MSDSWPLQRLAEVARETPEKLAWYADMGLLIEESPGTFAADSLRRLDLIRHAHRRGISDEDISLAVKEQGDLLGVFEELGTSTVTDQTLLDAARDANIPENLLSELTDFLGVESDDLAAEDDIQALQLLTQALALGLPEAALAQLIRVFADTTERLADAEVRIFHDHVHDQFRAHGITGRDLLAATESVGKPALDLVEPAVLYFHRRAYHKANRADFLRHLAEATTPPAAQPGETTVTVMFVDLAGFTPLTVTLGDSGVAAVLQRFASIVRRTAEQCGGRIIKQIGDAFMLVFDRPNDSIQFGLSVIAACDDDADLPLLHIGAHHGPVLYRDGDYFGNGVNLAARVTSATEAGQFLITADLRATIGRDSGTQRELPPRQLKGVKDPVPLVEILRADA